MDLALALQGIAVQDFNMLFSLSLQPEVPRPQSIVASPHGAVHQSLQTSTPQPRARNGQSTSSEEKNPGCLLPKSHYAYYARVYVTCLFLVEQEQASMPWRNATAFVLTRGRCHF